ncbi:MAG: hypothetical protein JSR77_15590 [Planctomycetes bacterium]|nr:hypothetical protein [Planctomycetota bacterium]
MRSRYTLITLCFGLAVQGLAEAQVQTTTPPTAAAPKAADPMRSFARLVSGEWRMTSASGKSMLHTWHWGPGKHSIRRMTGGEGAAGQPWREVMVVYWHPGRNQVCVWGKSPFAQGVSEGTIRFQGDAAEAVLDLYQAGLDPNRNGGRRKMGLRWTFDGPDKYHEVLLEASGNAGLQPLTEWDHVRSKTVTPARAPGGEEAPKLSEQLKAFEPLLGRVWEANGEWKGGGGFHFQTTFEWVPYAEALYARTVSPSKEGEPALVLDAYFYYHGGAKAVRCLAMSERGGVYEGEVTVVDGGSLQMDLKGSEGGGSVQRVVRLDFEQDGTLRDRVWSIDGAERTLMLDVHHSKIGT